MFYVPLYSVATRPSSPFCPRCISCPSILARWIRRYLECLSGVRQDRLIERDKNHSYQ